MIEVNDAHKIAELLPLINNANSWQEAKKICNALPELSTCYRWQDNSEVMTLLALCKEPVTIEESSDLWSRLYTVTMTSNGHVVKYSY